jgi:ketosteroid isomerase-like protein
MRHLSALAPLLLVGFTAPLAAQDIADTRAVTDRYIELTFGRHYDELLDVYAPDAVFFDPTGDVFQGRVSEGPVEGAEVIVTLQKSWGIADADFDIRASFTVGEYSLYRGTLTVQFQSSESTFEIPFMTVLRARDGRITERTDFGEYIESFELGERFAPNTVSTAEVAARYLGAYLDVDLELQAELMSEDVRFQDPTSQVFGPPSGELYSGAEDLLARRRQIFPGISDFTMVVEESFVANHHAVYMGRVRYTVGSGATYEQPAAIVIEVRGGLVTRHWDFVDYTVGPVGS